MDVFKLLDQINNAFKSGNINYILYGLCLLLMTWLYKHFKTHISEQDKETLKRLDSALEAYSNINLHLNDILLDKGNIDNLKISLSKGCIYLPKNILNQVIDLDYENKELLKELSTLIKKEIIHLKSQQLDSVTFRMSNNVYDNMEYYVSKSKFKLLYTPFIYSITTFLGIFLVVTLMVVFAAANLLNRLILITALFYFMFYFFVIVGILESVINKNFNWNSKNILAILVLLIAPFLGAIYLSKYILFIAFCLLIIYIKFFFKSIIKKN